MKTPAILLIAAIAAACTTSRPQKSGEIVPIAEPSARNTPPGMSKRVIPRAVIYKTNGNYDNNVAVNLNADRTALLSYPAPTDVDASSAPLQVADGFLLDRRGGIGPGTAFLHYTYAQYAALDSAPSPAEILADTIAGARVTEIFTLPIDVMKAVHNPTLTDSLVRSIVPHLNSEQR